MVIACWSAKGGTGTSTVAAALALSLASTAPEGALLADLAGDAPAVLGVPEPGGPGLAQWLAAADATPDALVRIEARLGRGLALLPTGAAAEPLAERADELVAALAGDRRPAVVDCGVVGAGALGPGAVAASAAGLSLLVLRPCYLALRRALQAPVRPSAVVLLTEPGRAIGRSDVEDVLGVPVRAEVPVDGCIARAVDAGLIGGHLPRLLERSLRDLVGGDVVRTRRRHPRAVRP